MFKYTFLILDYAKEMQTSAYIKNLKQIFDIRKYTNAGSQRQF